MSNKKSKQIRRAAKKVFKQDVATAMVNTDALLGGYSLWKRIRIAFRLVFRRTVFGTKSC